MGIKQKILNIMQKKLFKLVSKEKVYQFVASFPEPRDCLERAYFQYRCYKKLLGPLISFGVNLSAKIKIERIISDFQNNYQEVSNKIEADAVFFDVLGLSIVPNSLKKEFDVCYIQNIHDFRGMLNAFDIEYISEARQRYKKEPGFILQLIHAIAKYRAILSRYNIKAIITTDEIDYTKTALTDYCRRLGICHIGIMHGMKWAELRSTFFEFDRFYVWEEFFQDLCIRLGAEKTQFIVEQPDSVKLRFDNFDAENPNIIEYKFYLTISNKKELRVLKNITQYLRKNNKTILIRPHPRYTDLKMLKKTFSENLIEYPDTMTIEESVFLTENIISIDSTVLYQAYHSGKKIIVDDISNPKRTQKLRDVDFVVLYKQDCKRLSNIIEQGGGMEV